MALMLGQLYDALRAGNVPDDKARAAAEEVARHQALSRPRFETRGHFEDLHEQFDRIEIELRVLKGMTGFLIAVTLVVFALQWQILLRLPS